jgi:hypothetical protein
LGRDGIVAADPLLNAVLDRFAGCENVPIDPPDTIVAKAVLDAMCSVLECQPEHARVPHDAFALVIAILSRIPVGSGDDATGLVQLQFECTRWLALLVIADHHAFAIDEQIDKRVVVDNDDGDSIGSALQLGSGALARLVETLQDRSVALAARICTCNALSLALQTSAKASGMLHDPQKKTNDTVPATTNRVAPLERIVTAQLVALVLASIESVADDDDPRLLAGCLKLLFSSIFFLVKIAQQQQHDQSLLPVPLHLFHRVCGVTVAALSDPRDLVRMHALKLAGALFTVPESLEMPAGARGRMLALFQGIANLDENPEARRLAEHLLKSL